MITSLKCYLKLLNEEIRNVNMVDYKPTNCNLRLIHINLWLRIFEIALIIQVKTTWYDLTHWGRVTHICISKLTIIGSNNGLSPGRRQAIIWTNAGILLIRPLGTKFSEILIEIWIFSFKKIGFNMSSAKWRPFCLGLNVLTILTQWHRYLTQCPPGNFNEILDM